MIAGLLRSLIVLMLVGAGPSALAELVFNMTTIGNPGNAEDTPYLNTEVHVGAVSYG